MWNWWINSDLRGKLLFWGAFGIATNGIMAVFGYWMPKMCFVAIGFLLIGFCMRREDSTDI